MRNYFLVLTLCLTVLTGPVIAGDQDSDKIIKNADWTKMKKVTVSLEEYDFTPETLHFQTAVPYMLTIKNNGKIKHYFVSEGFFKGVALRKVQTSDGEIKAPYLTAIEVFPGKSVDLYFVPSKAGNYSLTCTVQGHAEKGMVGKIEIK
jgi:uncharacterized cupredoxin-like copper-binding protein